MPAEVGGYPPGLAKRAEGGEEAAIDPASAGSRPEYGSVGRSTWRRHGLVHTLAVFLFRTLQWNAFLLWRTSQKPVNVKSC